MKQNVIVTIDTEGHDGKDPISKLILGETKEGKYGIEYIIDILDYFGVKALFFVDFAEAWDYGEDKIRKVVNLILSRGHNVGVHIHPDHMADKNRLFLWEYSKEEQFDIISKCTHLYTEIVGQKPKSFRAGKYGADYNTLDILCELGYKYDFSSFYHQQWCGIEPEFTVNAPCRYNSLIEFPVTMHKTFHAGRLCREDKIDVEGMAPGELRYSLKQVVNQEFPVVITLFFHSFSLLKWRENPNDPSIDKKNIEKFKKAIAFVYNNSEYSIISESELDFVDIVATDVAINSHIDWPISWRGLYYTYLKAIKIARYNKKARYLLAGSGVVCIGLAGLTFAAIKHKLKFYK